MPEGTDVAMAPSILLTLAGFAGFVVAGAGLRSLSLGNDKVARACARWSIMFGILALALTALSLSAVIFWPLEATDVQGLSAPPHLLRAPMIAIIASSALAVVALPLALVVLRAASLRREIASSPFDASRREVCATNAKDALGPK
jgi:hypothetical protein